MSKSDLEIGPSTKVAALLDCYPELEETLIGIAPPFKKLKNPILRKSVAKVASLRQAAAAAGVPVADLVNTLRGAVGQSPIALENSGGDDAYYLPQPDWFNQAKVTASIDEEKDGNEDAMAITGVLQRASELKENEILELITSFLPAPGIDVMRNKGYQTWSRKENSGLIRTYFTKSTDL